MPLSVDPNYRVATKTTGPEAIRPAGRETTTVWWGSTAPFANLGLYAQTGDVALPTATTALIGEDNPVRALDLMDIDGEVGVAWAANNGQAATGNMDVQLARLAAPLQKLLLPQCVTDHNYTPLNLQIRPITPGLWSLQFSKQSDREFLAEDAVVVCDANQAPMPCSFEKLCTEDHVLATVRNPVAEYVHRPGDPDNVIYAFLAYPTATTAEETLNLAAVRVVLGDASADGGVTAIALGEPIVVSSGPANQGPDLPSIAFLGPDKLALAWIERGALLSDTVRMQRYDVCFPE